MTEGAQMQSTKKGLGEVLVEQGLLTDDDLLKAEEEHRRTGRSLGRVLLDLHLVDEIALVSALARQIGLEFVDLADYTIDPNAVSLVSEQVARRYRAIPIGFEDSLLVVAMADPSNVFALDDIRTITGHEVKPVVAIAGDVDGAIRKYANLDQSVEDIASEASGAMDEDLDLGEMDVAIEEAPIVKLVNLLITQAITDRASDIHVEPTEKDVRIRYRIDGVLHEVMRSPKNIQNGLISRLKVMADINIAERRIPQDGRVSLTVGGKSIDLRVATLPTVFGEKVVLRILDKSSVLLRLDELGFTDQPYTRYEQSFRKPYGQILVTGPTGSGKSTSLYATLNMINTPDRNIITVEDPVEYRLAGVNQVGVNPKAGLTFANALRSILRSDPDVVLVGEIRDRETAVIAVEAALTGHLVLSTLHTNDAPSAITRLVEMGVEPYLVVSALDCVVAQRLARKLCTRCREPYEPPAVEVEGTVLEGVETIYRAAGCSNCGKTGYQGRIGLFEVMPMTEELEKLTVDRASSEEVKRTAVKQGMLSLRQDGLHKVKQGVTSLEEVYRVVV